MWVLASPRVSLDWARTFSLPLNRQGSTRAQKAPRRYGRNARPRAGPRSSRVRTSCVCPHAKPARVATRQSDSGQSAASLSGRGRWEGAVAVVGENPEGWFGAGDVAMCGRLNAGNGWDIISDNLAASEDKRAPSGFGTSGGVESGGQEWKDSHYS